MRCGLRFSAQRTPWARLWLNSARRKGIAVGLETGQLPVRPPALCSTRMSYKSRKAHGRGHPRQCLSHGANLCHRDIHRHRQRNRNKHTHRHGWVHKQKAVRAALLTSQLGQAGQPPWMQHKEEARGKRRGLGRHRPAAPGAAAVCQGKGREGLRRAPGTGPAGGGAHACAWPWWQLHFCRYSTARLTAGGGLADKICGPHIRGRGA